MLEATSQNEVLLTAKQLTHRLDVTEMTIYNWRSRGLPTVQVAAVQQGKGFPIRFPLSRVAVWLVENKPTIAHKILDDTCTCRHCTKMRELTQSVAAQEQQVERVKLEQTA